MIFFLDQFICYMNSFDLQRLNFYQEKNMITEFLN